MRKWREMLEKVLMGSKYIWEPLPEALNPAEMFGADDQMGYFDHISDFIAEVEKRAYLAGFAAGAREVLDEEKLELDLATNQITAERKYLEWRE